MSDMLIIVLVLLTLNALATTANLMIAVDVNPALKICAQQTFRNGTHPISTVIKNPKRFTGETLYMNNITITVSGSDLGVTIHQFHTREVWISRRINLTAYHLGFHYEWNGQSQAFHMTGGHNSGTVTMQLKPSDNGYTADFYFTDYEQPEVNLRDVARLPTGLGQAALELMKYQLKMIAPNHGLTGCISKALGGPLSQDQALADLFN